jgi:carbon storage regulator CsrA
VNREAKQICHRPGNAVLAVSGRQVRVGIEAPKGITVHREEVFIQIQDKQTTESKS